MPWILTVAVGATLAWAVPNATEADRLASRAAGLRQDLGAESAAVTEATSRLEQVRSGVQDEGARADRLQTRKRKNGRVIAALTVRIEELEAAAAARAAAAASTSSLSASTSSLSSELPRPIPALPEPICKVKKINPETGKAEPYPC